MAKRTKLHFATDVHGSDKCFRKFLNAGAAYDADIVILGGDLAGKAIQALTETGGRFRCRFRGVEYDVEDGEELRGLEQLISDFGYYPYRTRPGELEARERDGSIDELFLTLMRERLVRWLELADERLRPRGLPVYWMLGNDDPTELEQILDDAPWGVHADERIEVLASGHELYSFGHSNLTPWDSYREMPEEEIKAALDAAAEKLAEPHNAIFNVHVPPYDTGLDDAPVLDRDLKVQASAGQAKMAPVGSTAVREVIEHVQPLLGLHGHVHEASGFRRLGRTLVINPGSDYGTGVLNGVLVTLEPGKVKAHQFVRG